MPDLPAFVTATRDGGSVLSLRIAPGASRSSVEGLHGDRLRIRVAAPPVDGKANKKLLAFLADRLGVPASSLEIVSGAKGRDKRVRVPDLGPQDLLHRLDLS